LPAGTWGRLMRPHEAPVFAPLVVKYIEPVQHFGTAGSISSDQAVMPPLTLLRCLKPCSRRNSTAFRERPPALQWI